MAIPSIILATAMTLVVKCAGSGPLPPDRSIKEMGRKAAELFGNGRFIAAMKMYRMAFDEAWRFDLQELRAHYMFNIGRIYYECARYDSAMHCFRLSRMMFAELGKRAERINADIFILLTMAYTGDIDSSDCLLLELGPSAARENEAVFVTARAVIAMLRGGHNDINRECTRALETLRRCKDDYGCGVIYYYKALWSLKRGDRVEARCFTDSSLIYYRRSGERYRVWKTLLCRAIAEYCDRNNRQGDKWYRRAVAAAPDMVAFPSMVDMDRCFPSVLKP